MIVWTREYYSKVEHPSKVLVVTGDKHYRQLLTPETLLEIIENTKRDGRMLDIYDGNTGLLLTKNWCALVLHSVTKDLMYNGSFLAEEWKSRLKSCTIGFGKRKSGKRKGEWIIIGLRLFMNPVKPLT